MFSMRDEICLNQDILIQGPKSYRFYMEWEKYKKEQNDSISALLLSPLP